MFGFNDEKFKNQINSYIDRWLEPHLQDGRFYSTFYCFALVLENMGIGFYLKKIIFIF